MKASDKKQFLAQYEEIHESLMRFCIVKSRGIMDPKDLANDVLLVGLENYHKLENKGALLSYLFTTANRICLNKIRRRKFDGHYEEDEIEKMEDPIHNVDSRMDISLLYAALDELPELQKEAVILFEISDLPIKEIMVIQNAGASAVKQRIKRGREKLVELMREKPQKKTAVLTAILFTSNSFSMSNLDAYFQVIKELPLPLSSSEAAAAVSNFQIAGTAANSTASKIGSALLKKTIIGSTIVGTVVGASVLLSNNNDNLDQNDALAAIETSTDSIVDSQNYRKIEKTIDYADVINETTITPNTINEQQEETINIDELFLEEEGEETLLLASNFRTNHTTNNISAPIILEGDSYPSASVETVFINHLGDNVELKTWDKDEIKVIPNHKIEAKTPEDEALIRENLNYKMEKQGGTLTLSSNICNVKKQKLRDRKKGLSSITFGNGDKIKFKELEVNYLIMLPKTCNLKLKGDFKSLIIPDMDGDLTASLYNSNLEAGSITGKADIKLRYSDATFGSYKDATIYLMDSDANFKTIEDLDLTAKYSTITADEIIESDMSLFESKLTATSIRKNLVANIKYSTVNFEKSNIDECELNVFESKLTLPKINELAIEMRYSTLNSESISSLTIPIAFESKLFIDHVDNFVGASSKYSVYKIGELVNEIEIHSFEDDLTISKTGLALMNFQGKYSSYKITLAKPADYKFDFDANYGSLDYGNLTLTTEAYETKNNHKIITGYFEAGNNDQALIKFRCFESKVQLD